MIFAWEVSFVLMGPRHAKLVGVQENGEQGVGCLGLLGRK